ncbi:MAG: peptidoglycan DD-metalloendopeptidase family protein [Patescibacteria group bacterium]|nr:peptidoglycan DD-metalloendopeptidase family protein [Patescibacteria group bacterium]
MGGIARAAFAPIRIIGQKILRVFILLGFRAFRQSRSFAGGLALPAKNTFMYIFTNRYTIHIAVALIAIFTSVSSLNAYEVRTETFGEGSLLYSIVGNEDLELTEETLDLELIQQEKSYGAGDALAVLPQVDYNEEPDYGLIQTVGEGNAVIQPSIPEGGESVAPRTSVEEYIVEDGDTLNLIAEKFNISLNTLLWANSLSAGSFIHPGGKLTILPTSGVLHTVKSGETVAGIAKKYKSESEKIIEFNKLASASDLRVSEKIVVPGGIMPAAPRPSYTAPVSTIFGSNPPPGSTSQSRTRLLWPTIGHRISQYYHWGHSGLDIAVPLGEPIYAAEAGTVTRAGWYVGYGNCIDINHGNGMMTRYGHASKIYVKPGDKVSRGQTVGLVGSTGRSTGPHIHLEVIINGAKYNPLSYIR